MEALLHALQLCIAIACTQHQMASLHCGLPCILECVNAAVDRKNAACPTQCVLGVYIFSVFAP